MEPARQAPFISKERIMQQLLLKSVIALSLVTSSFAHSGIVVDSTRHLYKEGSREINAHIENKDDTPYLIKSWVEAPQGKDASYFMVTPPLFRLEGNRKTPYVSYQMQTFRTHRKIVNQFISLMSCRYHRPAIVMKIKIRFS